MDELTMKRLEEMLNEVQEARKHLEKIMTLLDEAEKILIRENSGQGGDKGNEN